MIRRLRKHRKGSKAKLAREADKLWSELVRRKGCCEAHGTHAGPLQAAHGISRRYRHTRWLPINGFCLCAAHHVYYTHRPLEWDVYLQRAWGAAVYEELRRLALKTTPPDIQAALDKLRE